MIWNRTSLKIFFACFYDSIILKVLFSHKKPIILLLQVSKFWKTHPPSPAAHCSFMIDISLFCSPIKNPSHIFIFDIFHVYSEKLSSPLFQFFKSIIFLSFLFHRAYFPSHFCSPNRVFIFQNCCFVKIKILGIKNFFACIFL